MSDGLSKRGGERGVGNMLDMIGYTMGRIDCSWDIDSHGVWHSGSQHRT